MVITMNCLNSLKINIKNTQITNPKIPFNVEKKKHVHIYIKPYYVKNCK